MGVSKTLLVGAATVMTLVMPSQAFAAITVDADADASVQVGGEPTVDVNANANASVVIDGVAEITIGEQSVLPTQEEVAADATANARLAVNTDDLGVDADVNVNLNLGLGGGTNNGSVLGASTGTLPRTGVAGFMALLFSLLGSAGAARFATKRALV